MDITGKGSKFHCEPVLHFGRLVFLEDFTKLNLDIRLLHKLSILEKPSNLEFNSLDINKSTSSGWKTGNPIKIQNWNPNFSEYQFFFEISIPFNLIPFVHFSSTHHTKLGTLQSSAEISFFLFQFFIGYHLTLQSFHATQMIST